MEDLFDERGLLMLLPADILKVECDDDDVVFRRKEKSEKKLRKSQPG